MHVRLAAIAAWLLLGGAVTTPAAAADLMTLDDAFARVAQTHPELRLVDARATVLAAERDRSSCWSYNRTQAMTRQGLPG